jgi:hypothetical protein
LSNSSADLPSRFQAFHQEVALIHGHILGLRFVIAMTREMLPLSHGTGPVARR